MEKDRGTKVIALLALVVAVVGVSVGFAAFSNTLTISSEASVNPSSDTFNVDFSSASDSVVSGSITPTLTPTTLTANTASISNVSDPTITNLGVTFTSPGQSATYTFYAYNAGEYDAYLKTITYENASGESSSKVCTAGTDTTDTLVQAACDDISISVTVGALSVTGSQASITSHLLSKNTSEQVTVTITYAADGDVADGDFTVSFGDIVLTYNSSDS